MIKFTVSIIMMSFVFLAGCASTGSTPDSASNDDCFHIRQVNSWDAIDRKHIYLREGVNTHYLLTMFSSCQGVRYAKAIALSNHMGRVCPNDFGRITYRDAGMQSSCRIVNVERVESKEAAVALVESRTTEDEE